LGDGSFLFKKTTTMMTEKLITARDIISARDVITGQLYRTPMQRSSFLGDEIGVRLYLKLEMFQKTGSFKPRGVLNRLNHMRQEEKEKGVITLSAGNHAQAVSWAAAQAGVPATVVMPVAAVQAKVDATRGYGGEVIQTEGDLLQTCMAIGEERDLTLVHPFDHLDTIAGTGTLGMELVEDVPDVDVVIAGVGGGGLISGVAAALKLRKPDVTVIGVEPEGAPTMTCSLQKGEPVHLSRLDTIADGLAAPFVGVHNLRHVQAYVDDLVLVSDEEIAFAMGVILERCKVLAEPAAASTVAALLAGKITITGGRTVACILSGGNIDRERLCVVLG